MFNLAKGSKLLRKDEQGFTLIELMVVVIIIGILVAIAVPLYGGVQARARDNACAANVRTLNGAVAMYHAEEGSFPEDMTELAGSGFLQDDPECPNDGEYEILQDGGDGEYVVTCTNCSPDSDDPEGGENGEE